MRTPDIEKAIECLKGHSICLCKGEKIVTDDKKGIAPMMEFLKNEVDLSGFSAADLIVGKAAAMLFVKAKVVCVHGVVMSKNGKDFLEKHGVECSFDTLTENIINRQGTDICPMEKTVQDIDDAEEAFTALSNKYKEMKKVELKRLI